ncbi:ATP-binding cassette domain-containing protein, partial [Rhizobium ruizarguesonis]
GPVIFEMRDIRLLSEAVSFDLSLHEGEVVAVTGVLGAGKSRLLQAIFGVTALAGGQMFLDGRPYRPKSPAEAIAAGVAMAAED